MHYAITVPDMKQERRGRAGRRPGAAQPAGWQRAGDSGRTMTGGDRQAARPA